MSKDRLHEAAVRGPARATELMRMEEVSDFTGVPLNTLRYWRANPEHNKGPRSARLGKRVVYRRADIEAWIEAQFEEAI